MKEQLEDAIAEIGGELLEGSGFESEQPEKPVSATGRAQSPSKSAGTRAEG